MAPNLSGRNFLKLLDFTSEEIQYLIDLSPPTSRPRSTTTSRTATWRARTSSFSSRRPPRAPAAPSRLAPWTWAWASPTLTPSSSQMGKKESIEDTARVLGRMYDGIEYRGFAQSIVEDPGRERRRAGVERPHHGVPPHADDRRHADRPGGVRPRPAWAASLPSWATPVTTSATPSWWSAPSLAWTSAPAAPRSRCLPTKLVAQCREVAKESGATITLTEDVDEGAAGASVIYTDIWVSMGESSDLWAERIELLSKYQVNAELMAKAGRRCHLHALPAQLPRPQHHHWRGRLPEVRPARARGHRRGL